VIIEKTIKKSAKLGIWNIVENESWYFGHEQVPPQVIERAKKYKSVQRKLQSIGVYLLTAYLLKNNYKLEFEYSAIGKPGILHSSKQISISHAGSMVAVIISDTSKIGIDIERISDKVEKVGSKFLNQKEIEICDSLTAKDQYDFKHIVWGAKESMFKLYGIGGLDFKNNLAVSSFDKLNQSFTGTIKKDNYHEHVSGKYMLVEGYMLVYVIGTTTS